MIMEGLWSGFWSLQIFAMNFVLFTVTPFPPHLLLPLLNTFDPISNISHPCIKNSIMYLIKIAEGGNLMLIITNILQLSCHMYTKNKARSQFNGRLPPRPFP